MKKMNKKGFTLIELLAVIIILGVLMIIAIPSVTSYIQNSRKSAYVKSAVAYIDAVRVKVNEGKDLRLYSTNTLYMIPVGHDSNKSCVTLESGGKSPYSETWNYAYVGVVVKEGGYDYYFIGADGSNQFINLVSANTLANDGENEINKDTITSAAEALTAQYGSASDNTHTVDKYDSEDTGNGAALFGVKPSSTITEVVYIRANACKYQESPSA